MDSQMNGIIEIINIYTNQIERYEALSTWFAAFYIISLLLLLFFSGILLLRRAKWRDDPRNLTAGMLSVVFLGIPMLTTLYLYVFAMNMRKVALFRGYLSFLEEYWNQLSGLEVMVFNEEIIGAFFSFQSFLVNGLGPAVMSIFIVIALGGAFGLSIYFHRQLPG